ncbi:MAG: DUF1624 domain-containing protein, partial [Mesorhizobium sp.]
LDRLYRNDQAAEWQAHLDELAGACTAKADSTLMEGGAQ